MWRDRILVEAMGLAYATAGVLIVVDLYRPEYRLRGLGIVALILAGVLTIMCHQERCVGKAWAAGGRARERQLRLEQPSETAEMAVVHELMKR